MHILTCDSRFYLMILEAAMDTGNCGFSQTTPSIWADPPSTGAQNHTFFEELGGLAISVFEWFYNYEPSHIEAFIASIFCFIFAVAVFVLESLKAGGLAIVDMPVYFLVMSATFFQMGRNLRRHGQR